MRVNESAGTSSSCSSVPTFVPSKALNALTCILESFGVGLLNPRFPMIPPMVSGLARPRGASRRHSARPPAGVGQPAPSGGESSESEVPNNLRMWVLGFRV